MIQTQPGKVCGVLKARNIRDSDVTVCAEAASQVEHVVLCDRPVGAYAELLANESIKGGVRYIHDLCKQVKG